MALPAFSPQIYDEEAGNYLGYATFSGTATHFNSITLPAVPPAYSHLTGLINLFRSKLGPRSDAVQISITARFSHTVPYPLVGWSRPKVEFTSEFRLPHGLATSPLRFVWRVRRDVLLSHQGWCLPLILEYRSFHSPFLVENYPAD